MRTCIRNRTPGGLYFFTVNLAERHGNTLLTDKIDFGETPPTTPSAFGVHPSKEGNEEATPCHKFPSVEGNFHAHATPIPLRGGVARSAGVVTAYQGIAALFLSTAHGSAWPIDSAYGEGL